MLHVPTIGRTVIYTLNQADVDAITAKRLGNSVAGAPVSAGDKFPATIVKVFGTDVTSQVNLRVILDGDDFRWVTSATLGTENGQFMWPDRGPAHA